MHLLNTVKIWMIFMITSMIIIKKGKRKVLIVFEDMILHVMSNKKAQQLLKELSIRCRKLNKSLCFLTQSYFSVPKNVRLNCIHYVIFKLNNKRELQNNSINH